MLGMRHALPMSMNTLRTAALVILWTLSATMGQASTPRRVADFDTIAIKG